MTLELPGFEKYEAGQQIRRSSKSVRTNIVEGYARKRYQREYLKFLTYALASNSETLDHLETIWETGSLKNPDLFRQLQKNNIRLGIKINNLISAINRIRG